MKPCCRRVLPTLAALPLALACVQVLAADAPGAPLGADSLSPQLPGIVGVMLTLAGPGILRSPEVLASVDGVTSIDRIDEDSE